MNPVGPEFTPDEFGDPSSFIVPHDERTSADWVVPYINDAIKREVQCEAHGPIECRDWWYVPEFSIGVRGFIVDKHDRNIRGLSSRPDISLSRQFAAYAAGFRYDLMDLIITRVHDADAAIKFLLGRQFWLNAKDEVGPGECPSNGIPLGVPYPTAEIVRWTQPQIEDALRTLPCRFRSQRLHEPTYILHVAELPFEFAVERGT